jgi:hypothetical protein
MHVFRSAVRFSSIVLPLTMAVLPAICFGQSSASKASAPKAESVGIDPLALDVLKAVTDTLKNAKSFSFQTVMAKERLGTNDQIVTMFRRSDVTLSRPNKLRIHVSSEGEDVDVYYDQGTVTLYVPGKKLYSSIPVGDTLDKVVDGLEARDVEVPLSPLFRSDPYKALTEGLTSAAIIVALPLGMVQRQ